MRSWPAKSSQTSALTAQILHIPLGKIEPNPDQPRKHFDEKSLAELASTIKAHGLLQPVLVRPKGKRFVLAAGERRLRAARIAGLTEVPALVVDHDPLEVSLIENLQREDLDPIEEAEGYRLLADRYGYTHEQIAKKVGKSRSVITETLCLNRLSKEVKTECRTFDNYSKCLLLQVVRQKDRRKMLALWERIKEGGLTVREVKREGKKRSSTRCRSTVLPPLRTVNRLEKQLTEFDYQRLTEEEKEHFGLRLLAIVERLQEIVHKLGLR